MDIYFKNFGFYTIDIDYVKYLYSIDTQVFYDKSEKYNKKPYLGILTQLGDYLYCIPMTSAKQRQLEWKNITDCNYLIYSLVSFDDLRKNDIYKQIGDTDRYKKIFSVLEIRKMIPINESLCNQIDFSKITDKKYFDLLEKEYQFLIPLKQAILNKAKNLYLKQRETGTIKTCYCNFSLLEKGLQDYISKPQNSSLH